MRGVWAGSVGVAVRGVRPAGVGGGGRVVRGGVEGWQVGGTGGGGGRAIAGGEGALDHRHWQRGDAREGGGGAPVPGGGSPG